MTEEILQQTEPKQLLTKESNKIFRKEGKIK